MCIVLKSYIWHKLFVFCLLVKIKLVEPLLLLLYMTTYFNVYTDGRIIHSDICVFMMEKR